MRIQDFKEKWITFVNDMNKKGVPLPTIRDPKTSLGSVSLTLVFISFNIVAFGLIGKAAGVLGGVDLTQALNLFYGCAALYWGRKFQGEGSSLGDVEQVQPQSSHKQVQNQKVDDPDQA